MWIALALLPATGVAADEGRYVGAAACSRCHPAQFKKQSASGHAAALAPASNHRLAEQFPHGPTGHQSNFSYRLESTENKLVMVTSSATEKRSIPIEWAFGAGDQAVTFVSRLDDDRYLEHYLSFYPQSHEMVGTPGHGTKPPTTLDSALGEVYRTFAPNAAILRCFQCHSTGPLKISLELEIEPAEPGVRCEVCHGPGALHAVAGKVSEIRNPGRMTAMEQNDFCGSCHRPPAGIAEGIDWEDPWNSRHQPMYLARSACFLKSEGALRCTTCHDPHEPLRRNSRSWYDSRCTTCHQTKRHPPAAICRSDASKSCDSCHMPAVRPSERLAFRNHRIGIYREGSPLKPVSR